MSEVIKSFGQLMERIAETEAELFRGLFIQQSNQRHPIAQEEIAKMWIN